MKEAVLFSQLKKIARLESYEFISQHSIYLSTLAGTEGNKYLSTELNITYQIQHYT